MTIAIPPTNAPDSVFEEFWLQCPLRIARGTTRDVFEIPGHPDKVLKVLTRQSNFANWAEIVTYITTTDKSFFAEVYSWSWSGRFLVMERLGPITLQDLAGHKTPQFVNDKKPSNFGKGKVGRIKVLDYAALDLSPHPLHHFPASFDEAVE